jgi:hypothetical protein
VDLFSGVIEVRLPVIEQRYVVAVDGKVSREAVSHIAGPEYTDLSCRGH